MAAAYKVRSGQREFEKGIDLHRISAAITRRQYGKTTTASRIALKKMMRTPGHTVVFGSIKLDLGREIVRKESEQIRRAIMEFSSKLAKDDKLIDLVDTGNGKSIVRADADDFAEVYEAQRLEFRLMHSKTSYSRTKVVALTPEAVGETGDLILDEVGRVKKFREVWEAVKPIISSNPQFRCILTTTPPPDDTHYSFELLAPPIGFDPPISKTGNWYKSDLGVWVLRITADDAYEDGIPLYDDDTGEAITPAESRRRDHDKEAWDRNYGCKFVIGGTSACSLLALDAAQRRGPGQCAVLPVSSDSDFDAGLSFLMSHLSDGPVGLGWDLATTTNTTSNPSAFGVLEQRGVEFILRAVFIWKVADPDIALERARKIAWSIRHRKSGGPPRRLCVDATNERYFAQTVRKELGALLPVELVIASETIELPGKEEKITMKQHLGGQLVAELDDNHLWLPPERYLREDWRLVKKEKGQFVCEPDVDGKHGDSFDCTKYALLAIRSAGGAITPEVLKQIKMGGNRVRMPVFVPRRLRV